jgi:hypothetical protein
MRFAVFVSHGKAATYRRNCGISGNNWNSLEAIDYLAFDPDSPGFMALRKRKAA